MIHATGLYSRWEMILESAATYENPIQDVRVTVEFECEGVVETREAFWDGGQIWRVRFAPERCGRWFWKTRCSRPEDGGLHGKSGEFLCEPGSPADRGPLRVSPNRRHFEHADGTPFFWMGDTVWNGPLKASEADWRTFLSDRAAKGFNVIQFVATQWISAAGDAEGRQAYLGRERIRIDPAFFHRLDRRIDAINEHHMVAAPVLAWAAGWNADSVHLNPGNTLSEEQMVLLARYFVARYGAHDVVWILAGDGIYEGEEAERWKRIGRLALKDTNRLATMHPGGKIWVAPQFRDEEWFDFNGYQSGHWNDDSNFRWINEGPPSTDWMTAPAMPHVNLEPCYEGHKSMGGGRVIDAHDVRRACYWSLLAAPVAGITYGAHGVWSWESRPELPMSHPNTGIALAWKDAMRMPGSTSMAQLKTLFTSIEWSRLSPCRELLAEQPGLEYSNLFIAAACSKERDLAVIYLPEGGEAKLRPGALPEGMRVESHELADAGGPADRLLILRSNP
jgi:hypothetical protein